jgi:hypothetical protein
MGRWEVPGRSTAILALAGALGACATRGPEAVFANRIAHYMAVRGDAARAVGRVQVTDDPEQLRADAAALARQIQILRRGAPQGEVLGSPVAEYVRQSLRRRLRQRDAASLRNQIREVRPAPFAPRVNTRYPIDEPRASMPTAILQVLPRAPAELSYRFVGRDLLLLDRNTGLVVDVLDDALPPA